MFMCRNPRLPYNRTIDPWVCGCEGTTAFNKAVKADSHQACSHWQRKNMLKWLKWYEHMLKRIKDPGNKSYTGMRKYRNTMTFAPKVAEYVELMKLKKKTDPYQSDPILSASARYGISKDLVNKMIESVKEEPHDIIK